MSTSEAMWWLAQLQVWVVQKSCFDNKCSENNIRLCYEYSKALKYAAYDALTYMESRKPYSDIEYKIEYEKYSVLNAELRSRIDEYDERLYKDFLALYEQWNETFSLNNVDTI
jgi:hypothetical protein